MRTDPETAVLVATRLSRLAEADVRRVVRLALLRPAHLEILALLLYAGPQTALELSERLEWHQSRVGRDLRLMAAEGLVWRTGGSPMVWAAVE